MKNRALFSQAIAAGRSKSYAYRVAQGLHVLNGPMGPTPLTLPITMGEVVLRHDNGETLKAIAGDVGVSYRTLLRRFKAYKLGGGA